MDDLLFNILAVTATLAFVLGFISGWLPLFLASIAIAGLLYWLLGRLP